MRLLTRSRWLSYFQVDTLHRVQILSLERLRSALIVPVRIFGPGDFVGDGNTLPLQIVSVKALRHPVRNPEGVQLIIKLRPVPPQHERWWWTRRIAGDRRVIGSYESDELLDVQFPIPRDHLEETVRDIRRNVRAANRDYPAGYFEAARAAAQDKAASEAKAQEVEDDDQAVIDRILQEDLPED